jgi:hypothetical protein
MTTSSQPLDANGRLLSGYGFLSLSQKILVGNNATVAVPLFRITGAIECLGLWATVTTDLGANNTAAYFRLNDQTAQVDITLATGTTLSAAKSGSTLVKKGLAGAAVALLNNSAGRVSEPTTLETLFFSPFVVMKKTAATTDIEFVYSTTDAPTSGALDFFLRWNPLSSDADVTVQ